MGRGPGAGQDGGRGCWKAGGRAEWGEGCEPSLPGEPSDLRFSYRSIFSFFNLFISKIHLLNT